MHAVAPLHALDEHDALLFPDVVERWADTRPEVPAFRFLTNAGEQTLTYAGLDRRARAIAAGLTARDLPGRTALLVYPPGLEFICAFLACLYARVIPVVVNPPHSVSHAFSRLRAIARAAEACAVLAAEELAKLRERLAPSEPWLAGLPWIVTDHIETGSADGYARPVVDPDDLAFLQFTSGSTSAPKGVMVRHANAIANARALRAAFQLQPHDKLVSWLPMYHDMGLIGSAITPLVCGGEGVLMSPLTFLRRPIRWLSAISEHRATIGVAPDFAYALCARRITPEQREGLDLSRWRVALTGAEPVRPATLDDFARAFADCGFRRQAFAPSYGLAESTLMVTAADGEERPVIGSFDQRSLEHGVAKRVPPTAARGRSIVSCGRPLGVDALLVVDPSSQRPLPEDRIGEIWVAGRSVAAGYWRQPDVTREVFGARPRGDGGPRFLRTGDLGFLHEGQLYVTGRLKDLIVIHGRNFAPQDVEAAVEQRCRGLRPGFGAAFSVEADGEERLVVVYELEDGDARPGWLEEDVRDAVAREFGLGTHAVVLIPPDAIPRTTSGKIRRRACRELFLDGALPRLPEAVGAPREPAR